MFQLNLHVFSCSCGRSDGVSVDLNAAFNDYIDPGETHVGADGLRQMLFDRGYHDEDITDEYGECIVLFSAVQTHAASHRTSRRLLSVIQVLNTFGQKHPTSGLHVLSFENFKTMWAQLEATDEQDD